MISSDGPISLPGKMTSGKVPAWVENLKGESDKLLFHPFHDEWAFSHSLLDVCGHEVFVASPVQLDSRTIHCLSEDIERFNLECVIAPAAFDLGSLWVYVWPKGRRRE